MILITGDTHGRFDRFEKEPFTGLGQNDLVIICGDFGGIWSGDERQEKTLDSLARYPFTLLFADGNHENYDLLAQYPAEDWHGGRVQRIRENVLHLMRGEIFEIEGKSWFVMGGAACHDTWNGVLDPEAPDFEARFRKLYLAGEFFRVKGYSWWEQEMPSGEEIAHARKNLEAHGNKVDYVITHCAPTRFQEMIAFALRNRTYVPTPLTAYLDEVWTDVSFTKWYCGHYHHRMAPDGKLTVLYEDAVQPGE